MVGRPKPSCAEEAMPPLPPACRAVFASTLNGAPTTPAPKGLPAVLASLPAQDGQSNASSLAKLGAFAAKGAERRPQPEAAVPEESDARPQALRAGLVLCAMGALFTAVLRRAEASQPKEKVQHEDPKRPLRPQLLAVPGDDGPEPQLPAICPPFMRATGGAQLSLRLPKGDCSGSSWSSDVSGIAATASLRGPAFRLMSAAVSGEGSERALELYEHELGEGAKSSTLLKVNSKMEFLLGGVNDAKVLGTLKPLAGGRHVLELAGTGSRGVLAVSAGHRRRSVEIGSLSSGRRLATAEFREEEPEVTGGGDGESFQVTSKPGIDAALALACALAVLTFAPTSAQQKSDRKCASDCGWPAADMARVVSKGGALQLPHGGATLDSEVSAVVSGACANMG